MDKVSLREIFYKYAEERGGGLPLTPQEMCNAVVLWVQQYVSKDNPITVEQLNNLIEGSETVVVDISESNDKLEIHLDSEIVAKLDRAILTPLQRPSELVLPVVTETGDVVYEPARSFGGGELYSNIISGRAGEYSIDISFFTKISYGSVGGFLQNVTQYNNTPCGGYLLNNPTSERFTIYNISRAPTGEIRFYHNGGFEDVNVEKLLLGSLTLTTNNAL